MPDRTVNRGDSRSLTDSRIRYLTCTRADQRPRTPEPSKLVTAKLDVSCGVQQSPGQAAQGELAEFVRPEPADVTEFAVRGSGHPTEDPGFIDRRHVGGPVTVG